MNQKYLSIFFRDLTTFGGALFYAFIILLGLAFHQTTLAVDLALGFVIGFILLIPLRLLYFKNRPQKETYSNLIERLDASSFPSWHTARIVFFAITGIIYFKNTFLTIISITLVILVGYSRIYLKKHDWIDVLGGIVLAGVTYGIVTVI